MAKKESNIIKYPKHFSFRIGYVFILIMFIYVSFHVFSYITKKNITVYEVTNGTISSNREFNALAIREEELIQSAGEGTILYLASNFQKIGARSQIYAIDSDGSISSNMNFTKLDTEFFSPQSISKLSSTINDFMLDFNPSNFNKVYNAKTDISTQIDQLYSAGAMKAMAPQIEQAVANGSFSIYYGSKPGVVVYSTDGMEDLKVKDITPELLSNSSYTNTIYNSKEKVFTGQTIGKLITSDKWNLIIQLDDELKAEMEEDEYVHIEFLEDEVSTWCTCKMKEKNGKTFLVIGLDDGVDRYCDSRYIHIKLLDRSVSGLKIPNSAIVEKEFFEIPKSYFYQGNDTNGDLGLMVKSANANNFVVPDIFYETDNTYYIDSTDVSEGDVIMKAGSTTTYVIGTHKSSLKGVYNINKGYTIFKIISIKYQNDDYSVIESGTNYGVSMYDHIVLQGDTVNEGQLIN